MDWQKKPPAFTGCSNIHDNGEQQKENKIKEPNSSVMYSLWSIWDCSREQFHTSFSTKALWWTISSVPWIFSFCKVSFQNLTSIKISEDADHRNVGGKDKDNKRLILVFLSPITEYFFSPRL